MTQKRNTSVDSFSPRNPLQQLTTAAQVSLSRQLEGIEISGDIGIVRSSSSDVKESLRGSDNLPEKESSKGHRFRKRHRGGSDNWKRKAFQRCRKRIIWLISSLFLSVQAILILRAFTDVSRITHSDLLSLVTPGTPSNTDSQGRTNILIFGTSQDDTANQDANGSGGMWLTDSIMVLSLNQNTYTVTMISVPRDLLVNMPIGCLVGYQAKINAVYECGANLAESDDSAQKSSKYLHQDQAGAEALETSVQK